MTEQDPELPPTQSASVKPDELGHPLPSLPSETIRGHPDAGASVLVKSCFARCLTPHRALGARLGVTLPDSLPRPLTYCLHRDEAEHRRRLAARDRLLSHRDYRYLDIARTAGVLESPMQRVQLTTARAHVLRTDPATREDGLRLLDEAARIAARSGLGHQLRSVEAIRRTCEDAFTSTDTDH
ncbi:hypothetical protein [Streptomyces sp. SPB074]|uniref:hypothetical protein n=1 Tax=Streptomyces sp. (strain SPB074) TaxID=465543 RepID=UPI00017F2204|nr:hypothetical protein [Streptomyces sp. SPB074]EDY43099.1 hypothetical protein SSBG_01061 [Streptomyces sp. SPB074]